MTASTASKRRLEPAHALGNAVVKGALGKLRANAITRTAITSNVVAAAAPHAASASPGRRSLRWGTYAASANNTAPKALPARAAHTDNSGQKRCNSRGTVTKA